MARRGEVKTKPSPIGKAKAREQRKRATKEAEPLEPIDLPANRRDVTELQRSRVEELFSRNDRRIAEQMIAEGYFVKPAARMTDERYREFVETCRRTVNNHRHALIKQWEELPEVELGDKVATREFVARLRSLAGEVLDVITTAGVRPTAKINGFAELRQLETLAAKANGVDIDWKRYGKPESPDGDSQTELPFVGVFADMKHVDDDTRKLIQDELRRRGARGKNDVAGGAAAPARAAVPIQRKRAG